MNYRDYYNKIECELLTLAKDIPAIKVSERAFYMKVKMPLLGLPVPVQRRVAKKHAKALLNKIAKESEVLELLDFIYKNAQYHELRLFSLYFIDNYDFEFENLWQIIKCWPKYINCWDMSDYLSKNYNIMLKTHENVVMQHLLELHKSNNFWEQRIALVSLVGFNGIKQFQPNIDIAIDMAKDKLEVDEYYLQKGLGWLLRDLREVYPEEIYDFLHKNATKLNSVAFSVAVEKLEGGKKDVLKAIRQDYRKSKKAAISKLIK